MPTLLPLPATGARAAPPALPPALVTLLPALALLVLGTAPAAAQPAPDALPRYQVQMLAPAPVPAGWRPVEQPLALNNRGQVAGYTELRGPEATVARATLWSPAGARDLGATGWDWATAQGVNDGGLAAGTLINFGQRSTAVRWNADGTLLDLGARTQALQSRAMAINGIWQVVGQADVDNDPAAAVLWQPDGSVVNIGHLWRQEAGHMSSLAVDIDDNGHVLGRTLYGGVNEEQGWRWSLAGGMQALQQAAPNSHDRPQALNSDGWVVGYSVGSAAGDGGTGQRALMWDPQGQIVEIQGNGYSHTQALDINAAGLVVGTGDHNGAGSWIWSARTGMVDLDGLIDGAPSFHLVSASSINAFGQISGWGYDTLTGLGGVVLLTPVPEPAPAVLLAVGLAVLGWRCRGRTAAQPAA